MMARRIDPRQPNPITSQPATVQACAGDRRSEKEQTTAAGAARDQLAFTQIAATGVTTEADDS
ncbi:hypothetical protein [Streptomyces sp. NPDC057257]|uniref:hypothetical protein n=1 Tax=Streptomyces sp. NPDC057257 TaxID=3346071 RepID=UPI0036282F99